MRSTILANIYPSYTMGYDQPPKKYSIDSNSTNKDYDIFNNPPSTKMSYHIPYQIQGGFETNTWENL